MWTPKRVLLLAAGFVVFFLLYLGYAHFLGGIDGLPPLPAALWPRDPGGALPPIDGGTRTDTAEQLLEEAFGVGSPEVSRPHRVGSRGRGVALAFEDFEFEKDGRLRLWPISLALFGKPTPKGKEINTLRADLAFITLDRPISGPHDISSHKIVAVQLEGKIKIVHNRRTPALDDDIDIFIDKGPVYYDESKRLITTNDDLVLKDMQSKPEPMRVTATGLDVHLGSPPTLDRKAPPRGKPDKELGVERIVLRSNVHMHLYVAAGSGFPTPVASQARPRPDAPAGKPGDKPGAKDHIYISTPGAFQYDLATSQARFDIPVNPARRYPERVVVTRNPEREGKRDSVDCEHLVLQFRRRDPAAPGTARRTGEPADELQIETAQATGREVVVASESELLDAHGNSLTYDARTRTTIFKGDPEMWLLKEGNEIHARELELVSQPGVQQITARGTGRIHLLDKSGKRFHARWKGSFVSSRDGPHDLLTFNGGAAFVEDEKGLDPRDIFDDEKLLRCKTFLKADRLQVWLEPRKESPGKPDARTPVTSSPRPHQMEAAGNVLARSPDLFVHDTEQLIVLFKDISNPNTLRSSKPSGSRLPTAALRLDLLPEVAPADASKPAAGGAAQETPAKTPRPIDLSARYVRAHVWRNGPKSELDRLHTEGAVRVLQAPNGPDDKGVDLRGSVMDLERKEGGNKLDLRGGADDLAELRLDKLYITGPHITIDQSINRAWMECKGLMHMESKTDFQGKALLKPIPLEVMWDGRMDFDGNSAEFHGGVQASQGSSWLRCENLQVFLDRAVSLKEGNRGKPSPHARKLTADQRVWVVERTLDPMTRKMIAFHRLDCDELNVLTEENQLWARGPGWVRSVQEGGGEFDFGATPGRLPAKRAPDDWQLTLVKYTDLMRADNRKRTATFDGSVEVLYLPSWPASKHDVPIDVDQLRDALPPGALLMEGDRLTVFGGSEKNRKDRTLDVQGKVLLRAADARGQVFIGRAEEVHYDQEKDQVILDGKGGEARLSVYERKGARPKVVKGKRIIYLRRTGEVQYDGVTEIYGTN